MENLSRPLPQTDDAEKAVLGAILIENSSIHDVLEILLSDDFYKDAHRKIFQSMIDLEQKSEPIDVLTLYEFLKSKGNLLEEVGGSAYLTYLTELVPSTVNVSHYARLVKDKSILRNIVLTATEIAQTGYDDKVEAEQFLDQAEKAILEIAQSKIKPGFYNSKELSQQALELIESLHSKKELITGVSTGFEKLDSMTSGLQASDLIIIAARPGLGKTSFSLNIASNAVLNHGMTVGMFSLEMSKEQLMLRLLSMKSKVNFSNIRSGYIKNDDLEKLVEAAEHYSKSNLYIDDSPALTVIEVRAKARRQKREHGLDLLIVDYLQLMRGLGRNENREREIAEISGSLKALAKELSIPVIGISQLSRQTETRSDRRPQLADLRESGAIEQDADVVMFIHRADAYKKDPEEKDGIAELIIGKQRNGPVGSIKLAFLEGVGVPSFENLAPDFDDEFY